MDNPVKTALPTAPSLPNAALLRNTLISRTIFPFADDEDPSTFNAIDTDTGAVPLGLYWNGLFFKLDPSDTTTPGDNISVIQTADGYRYKLAGFDLIPFRALSRTTNDPPDDPDIGDSYIVTASPSGDWVGHADDIMVFTSRGWEPIAAKIGFWVYVEDEDVFVRYTTGGAWSAGPGPLSHTANSIPLSAVIALGLGTVKVENQTTNTPPSSPTVGQAYIIGSSPTGAWISQSGKVAICQVAGQFTIYTPAAGDEVYDKALAKRVRWSGSAWSGALPAMDLIYTVLANNSATVDIVHGQNGVVLDDTYDAYELRISGLKVQTDNVSLLLQFGTGSTPTWVTSGYRWGMHTTDAVQGFADPRASSDTSIGLTAGNGIKNSAGCTFEGVLSFNNPEATDRLKIHLRGGFDASPNDSLYAIVGVGRNDTAQAITGLRVKASSGNIVAGRFALYGLRKS
jgi:hypothetical protein